MESHLEIAVNTGITIVGWGVVDVKEKTGKKLNRISKKLKGKLSLITNEALIRFFCI